MITGEESTGIYYRSMADKRTCNACWFYEKDGTNWFVSKNAEVKPKPGQEWCTLNNAPCPAARTCPSWMTTAGARPNLLNEGTLTKQEKDAVKKEKRRQRRLERKET